MSRPLVVSIPHNLGKAEALRRIRDGIGQVQTRFAQHLTVNRESWEGNRLDFDVTALRQSLSGSITVEESSVTLDVQLPWVLSVLAEKAKALIARQGTLMLEKK